MNMRVISAALILCMFWQTAARAGDTPAKLVKTNVRAADGLNLVCGVGGKGDTALIFLHGWSGDRAYWKHQVGVFAPEYRVVVVDQAGHGESGKDRKNWTINGLADDVDAVAKSLGLKRAILVGHSMGGPVALIAAKRMPEKVVAVIGVDTLQNVDFKMPEDVTKKFRESIEKDFKGAMRTFMDGLLSEKNDPALKDWLLTRAQAQDEKIALALMRDLMSLDRKELLREAKKPVRCINSGGGFAFFTPTDSAVNKKYADFDAVTIDAVGHYPMLERPAAFNEKLREVLKEFAVKN